MERFDIHEWKPTECRNVAEIETALRKFNVIGKKIVSLRTIGAAENFNNWEYDDEINEAIKCAEEHKQYGNALILPIRAVLLEPAIFTFEDGSTLEIMSKGNRTLLIASNQIQPEIIEGANDRNFNSENFFRTIKNCSLTGQVSERISDYSNYEYFNDCYSIIEYGLDLNRDGIRQNFYVAVSCLREYDEAAFMLSFNEIKTGQNNPCLQELSEELTYSMSHGTAILISEGKRWHGGFLSVYPLNRTEISENNPFGTLKCLKELISIDYYQISKCMAYFLIKYFDYDYDYGEMRMEHSDGYEEYDEFNLYSYATMRKMLEDIKKCAYLLENDFENPDLDSLKTYFYYQNERKTAEEKQEEIKQLTPIAIDFYRRIVPRLEAMMKNAPDYEFICFFGP